MNKPPTLKCDFERSEFSDAYYAVFGRALTIATRFEAGCRNLGMLIGLENPHGILESKESLSKFIEKITTISLEQHTNKLGTYDILDEARNARNAIVFEITLGLDRRPDFIANEILSEKINRVYDLCLTLAKGDILVGIISLELNGEDLPTGDFLKKYPERIAKWVVEI